MTIPTSPPMRVAHYEVIELLDNDGTVRTYRARDMSSRRTVTLKLVLQDFQDQRVVAKLTKLREQARVSEKLKHPGIVEILEYGEEGPLAFIASEFVEGCRLKPQLRIQVADAASVIVQLLEALECAHVQGVVHLGLKPSCLVLTSKGQLKIRGFGLSHRGQTIASYLAPEQRDGSELDHRVDLYSAGILFYELLTGNHPYARAAGDIPRESLSRENYPSRRNADVPVVFDPICAKALEKQPEDRYLSAHAFSEDVHRAFRDAFGSPLPRLVSNESVVSIFLTTLRGSLKKKRAGRTIPKAPLKASVSVEGPFWPEELLSRVTQELAAFLGTLAKSVVNEAASVTNDLDKLYELAAESLKSPKERRAFLAGKAAHATGEDGRSRPGLESTPAFSPVRQVAVMKTEMDPRSAQAPVELAGETSFSRRDASGLEKSSRRGVQVESPRDSRPSPGNGGAVRAAQPQKSQPRVPEPSMHSRLEELLGVQPESLAGYLKAKPPDLYDVIHAFVAVTKALLARHAEKNRPAGLTPEGISFDRLGNATIRVSSSTVAPGSTLDGATGGPRYAAPEIFQDKNDGQDVVAASADIYTLGFMFYEILLGKELFSKTFPSQRSDLDWLRWHTDPKSKAPALKQLQPEHPAALSDLLESMMAKDAAGRLSDVAVVLSRLRAIAQQTDKTIVGRPASRVQKSAPPSSLPAPKKGRLRPILAVLLLLALVASALVLWQNPGLYQSLVPLYRRYFAPHAAVDVTHPSKE